MSASTPPLQALNWAERYQGPVILLSEHALSERQQNIPKPDLSSLTVESRKVYTGANGYQRYEGYELSPMPIPGNPGSLRRQRERARRDGRHDPPAEPAHPDDRRGASASSSCLEDGVYESDNTDSAVALMPWGGSKGPAFDAYRQLSQSGMDIGWYYTMYLNPLPPALLDELRTKELVLVPELNYLGQFSSVLRSLGVRAESITQYTGLPFKVGDLVRMVSERTGVRKGEGVAV